MAEDLQDRKAGIQVHLALVHHANQYLITQDYANREGIGKILGLRQPGDTTAYRRGLFPLLQMHLDYRVPLHLQVSGTLIETLAWHYPESFFSHQPPARRGLA